MQDTRSSQYSSQRGERKYEQPQRAPELPQLPKLLNNGNLNPEIFKEELLMKIAISLENVSKTQMRKVFDEIKRFKFMLESGESWDRIYPFVLLQKSKISYLCKRKSKDSKYADYYANLKKLVFNLINMCDSKETYLAYATFIEALYGFYFEIAKRE